MHEQDLGIFYGAGPAKVPGASAVAADEPDEAEAVFVQGFQSLGAAPSKEPPEPHRHTKSADRDPIVGSSEHIAHCNFEDVESDCSSDASSVEVPFAPPPLPPPAPPPAPVEVAEPPEPPEEHKFWWITRTGRQAKCETCKCPIFAHSFRSLYVPDPAKVEDKRQWQRLFWKYYHLHHACLPGDADGGMPTAEQLIVDAARLPARFKETPEQFRQSVDDATDLFFRELCRARAKLHRFP